MMTKKEFAEWCIYRHDVEVRQSYDGNIPYSKHLEYVVAHFHRFKHVILGSWIDVGSWTVEDCVYMACCGHDLIEDARVTYNDLVDKVGEFTAEIIFGCTESTGRTRADRHDVNYYERCAANDAAIFVKLCDIMANVTYSILTDSKMYHKHKAEHEKTKLYLYKPQYRIMFDYLDKLFTLWP